MRSYLSIGLCLGLVAVASGAIQKGNIEVTALSGRADLLNNQDKRAPLTRGLIFQEGRRVETQEKSTTDLVLSNGSTIKVNPNTLMEVKAFSQVASPLIVPGKYAELSAEPSPSVVQIEVYRGKIDGEVRKLSPNTQYTIKTPVGIVRVRGTTLSVSYDQQSDGTGKMRVTCTAGAVQVRSGDDPANHVVGAGQQVEIVGEPGNVKTLPNKPADINGDGIPDKPVDVNGDGKADGVDVNGDGKADKLVSTRSDGKFDAVDTNGDGKADGKLATVDGAPVVAIDANKDGVPEAVITLDEVAVHDDKIAKTPLTYPEVLNGDGKKIEIKPVEPTERPPVKVEPIKPEPKPEEPKKEEPKKEEPKTEDPKTEEPKKEEPKTEEPKKEEPKPEEPKPEEPKPEAPKPPPPPPVEPPDVVNVIEKETQKPVSPSGG